MQAYAAGLLEGSLTWQVIHHHWHNTIGSLCGSSSHIQQRCLTIRRKLRDNAAVIRKRADLLATEDPFWHMVINQSINRSKNLTRKVSQVCLTDFNDSLICCRVSKNKTHVIFFIGGKTVLRGEIDPQSYGCKGMFS